VFQLKFDVFQVLWPLFHYLLWQDVATEYASADSHYPPYKAANEAFAKKIAEVYKPGASRSFSKQNLDSSIRRRPYLGA
jgi:hypothetical protein